MADPGNDTDDAHDALQHTTVKELKDGIDIEEVEHDNSGGLRRVRQDNSSKSPFGRVEP